MIGGKVQHQVWSSAADWEKQVALIVVQFDVAAGLARHFSSVFNARWRGKPLLYQPAPLPPG
jgi:hypothetical protein